MLIIFASISFTSFNLCSLNDPIVFLKNFFLHSRFSVKIKLPLYSVSSFLLLNKFGTPVKIGYAVVIINSKISVPKERVVCTYVIHFE